MQQTLGEKLTEARQRTGMRIQDAADATHIRRDYLEALESNQFEKIDLMDVYRRGYVKIYARYLGLDPGAALRDYEQTAESRGIRSSPASARNHSRLSPAAFDRGDTLGYDKDNSHAPPGGDKSSDDGFGPPSALKPGKRPAHPAAPKKHLWIYGGATALVLIVGTLAYHFLTTKNVPAPQSSTAGGVAGGASAAPTYYRYIMEIRSAVDTTVEVIQEKDGRSRNFRIAADTANLGEKVRAKLLNPPLYAAPNPPPSPVKIDCEGPIRILSPDIGSVYVKVDNTQYTASDLGPNGFRMNPAPPKPTPAAGTPAPVPQQPPPSRSRR